MLAGGQGPSRPAALRPRPLALQAPGGGGHMGMGRARPLELLQGRAPGRRAVSPVCWGEPETWESDLLGRYKNGGTAARHCLSPRPASLVCKVQMILAPSSGITVKMNLLHRAQGLAHAKCFVMSVPCRPFLPPSICAVLRVTI